MAYKLFQKHSQTSWVGGWGALVSDLWEGVWDSNKTWGPRVRTMSWPLVSGFDLHTHSGHPSKVETVKRAIMAARTLSKSNLLFSQLRGWMMGWSTSPSLYVM